MESESEAHFCNALRTVTITAPRRPPTLQLRYLNNSHEMYAIKIALLLLLLQILTSESAPAAPQILPLGEAKIRQPRAAAKTKKDIFVSRGWGAGGMPFNVLYMNRSYALKPGAKSIRKSAPKSRAKDAKLNTKNLRAATKYGRGQHHPVIPQLFVSYRWSPIGK